MEMAASSVKGWFGYCQWREGVPSGLLPPLYYVHHSTLYERQLHILCMFMFRLSSVPSGVRPTTILRPLVTCFVWSGRYIYIRMDLKKEEEERLIFIIVF